jgi:hypothetical protein
MRVFLVPSKSKFLRKLDVANLYQDTFDPCRYDFDHA